MGLLSGAVSRIISAFLRVICRFDGEDLVSVPMDGPLIIVLNHINFLEVPLIYLALRPRRLRGLVKSETWRNPVLGVMAKAWDAIPLDRSGKNPGGLRNAEAALGRGEFIAIAPEGKRTGGHLEKGHAGVALLAARANAAILPVAHWGGEAVWKNMLRLRKTRVRFSVGRPFRIKESAKPLTRMRRDEVMDEVMVEIARLLPIRYRGVYAGTGENLPQAAKYLDFGV